MKKKKCRMTAAVLAGAVTLTVTGCGAGTIDGSQTAATVDGEEISMGLLSFFTRYQQAQTSQMYMSMLGTDASSMWDEERTEEEGVTYGDSLRDDTLTQLEDMCLLKLHAEEYEVAVSEEKKQKIEEAAAQFMEDNDAQTQERLAVTQEDIERFLELTTYYMKMQDPIKADVDTNVSDEEAAQTTITYVKVQEENEDAEDAGTGESEEASDETKEQEADARTKAQQILDQVLVSAEADMDAIAESVDETLSASTVSYSTNDEEDTTVPDVLKEAVSSLQDGEVNSSLVEDEGTYYVVRLDQAFDEEATENQKDTIISERKQDLYDETLEGWREEADIQENDRNVRKLKVTSSDSYTFKEETADEETQTTQDAESTAAEETQDTGTAEETTQDSSAAEE